MGDYFKQTFEKCVLGVTYAAIHGRPVSPSTEENCAVAARELREAIEQSSLPHSGTQQPQQADNKIQPSREPQSSSQIYREDDPRYRKLTGKSHDKREKLDQFHNPTFRFQYGDLGKRDFKTYSLMLKYSDLASTHHQVSDLLLRLGSIGIAQGLLEFFLAGGSSFSKHDK